MLTFVTYNTKDYERFAPGETEDVRSRETEEWRYRLLEQIIKTISPGVIALQELPGHSQERANAALAQLAEATGMQCMARKSRGPGDPGAYAVAPGSSADLAVGLMWADSIEPVPGSWLRTKQGLWHSLAAITLDVGGAQPVQHASSHLPPRAGGRQRGREAAHISELLAFHPYTLLGLDQNSTGADRHYEPLPSLPHFSPAEITERLVDDHAAAETFMHNGLIDAAHWLDVGRYRAAGRDHNAEGRPLDQIHAIPTTGHEIDPQYGMANYGSRHLDVIRASRSMLGALSSHRVIADVPGIFVVSDHLPAAVTYDPLLIAPL
jgi:hypothetical protein